MKHLIVIGAGASGMTAALAAAKRGEQLNTELKITLIEQNPLAGRKILVTGNGRCNLGNLEINPDSYHCKDRSFVETVLQSFSIKETQNLFEEMGLKLWNRDGYLYPLSRQAASVVQIFVRELGFYGIKVRYSTRISEIKKEAEQFKVITDEGFAYICDAVILATGSAAGNTEGATNIGYEIAASLGHTVDSISPALVQVLIRESWKQKLAGVRVMASILLENGISEYGEIQFTEYGLSGIPVFQLSGTCAERIAAGKTVAGKINLLPAFTEEEIYAYLHKMYEQYAQDTVRALLEGIVHEKIRSVLLELSEIKANSPMSSICEEQLIDLCNLLTGLPVTITGTNDISFAQTVRGGVSLDEIDPGTMESCICKNLYLTGELPNVDGRCGGYNLQWAWSTGFIAGTAAAERLG